ncbi:hypothetical protein R3W88_008875 [Solanum pinnatisectum]|uniref:WRKY domain-containing protein n=1 Tax=Solanum pinnatisectum TaxID=50273 RepID=A0AAV9MCC9_9SOLN|nr:hypothetical protein R3W88_008875 [Solanum pinnatisectum]
MEDNDWDLSAVVRSCNINKPNYVTAPNSGLVTSENDDWSTFDKNFVADMPNFNDLYEIFSIDFSVIIMDQNKNQEMYLHPIQPTQFRQQIFLSPFQTMITCVPTTTTTPQQSIDLQQQLVMQDQVYPSFTMPMQTPLIKTFKRKNQSTRVFYEVLQEELTNDKWAWRKYGQKSIKGSPFPRNYFKCSTSGSCKATKIIEKSRKNENYFLVSLALYNNSSKRKLPKSINIVAKALNLNASSSSSKRAKHFKVDAFSISPTAPALEIERNNEMVDVVVENKDDIEDERRRTRMAIFSWILENSKNFYFHLMGMK